MAKTRLKDITHQIQNEAARRDALEQRVNDRLDRMDEQQCITGTILTQLDNTVRVLIDKMSSMGNNSQAEGSGTRNNSPRGRSSGQSGNTHFHGITHYSKVDFPGLMVPMLDHGS